MAGQEGKRAVKDCKGNSGESLHYTIIQNRAQQDKGSQVFSFLLQLLLEYVVGIYSPLPSYFH